jgi:hypothetical protein
MEFSIFFLVTVIILIAPIKLAATWVGAQNTGIISCFIAILVTSAVQQGFSVIFPELNENIGTLIGLPLDALVYMLILNTTFIKGIIIALIQTILILALAFVLAAVLL